MAQLQSTVVTGSLYISGSDPRVGIGTTTPSEKLHVINDNEQDGTVKLGGSEDALGLVINYDQSSATTTTITSNPSYTNTGALMILRVDGDDSSTANQLVLKGDGNVGIGTTSPDTKLHIVNDSATTNAGVKVLTLTQSTSGTPASGLGPGISFVAERPSSNILLERAAIYGISGTNPDDDGALTFFTRTDTGAIGVSEKMRIDSNGNVGIGTATPTFSAASGNTAKGLHIQNVGNDTQASLRLTGHNNTGTPGQATFTELLHAGGNLRFDINHNGTTVLSIDSSHNVGIGTTSVSSGFKTEIAGGDFRVGDTQGEDAVELGWSAGGSQGFVQAYDRGDSAFRDLMLNASILIKGGGNVGIGTNSPENKLHIVDTSNPGNTSGSVIIEGRRDGTANLLTLRAKDVSSPASALPDGQGSVLRWQGFDGTDFENMGYILVNADGQAVANSDAPSYMAFGTSANGSSTPAERMRIDSSGNVILNTDTSTTSKGITIGNLAGTAGWNIGNGLIANNHQFVIYDNTAGSTRLLIDSSGNVGIGASDPNNKLEVEGSSLLKGLVTVTDDIFPEQNYVSNIGSINKKFLTLNVAELIVESLVASERRSTVGGRFNVGISTQLSQSIDAASTSILVENNNLNKGDIIHLEGGGKVEFMKVTSTNSDTDTSTPGDGYIYTVDRNLDGTEADNWDAGTGVFNTGVTGSAGNPGTGFIDQYAINSLTTGVSTAGPTIAFMERTGSAYQDIDIRTGVGNLKGWYGYTTDKFGLAAGDYRNNNITVDESNGLRIRSGSSIQLHASSSKLSIGDSFLYDSLNGILYVSGSNIQLVTPSFFLGGENQYISGSGGSIEISGSNFHLLNGNITASNVDLSGKITATSGEIGGFGISADAIFGDNFYLSGSATGNEFFISSSKFNVKANGDVTASNADITGKISATSGEIGGWTINDGDLSSTNITLSSDNESIALGSPTPGNLTSDGIFLSGSGEFNFQLSPTKYIRQSGGVLDIQTDKFFIGNEATQFISGANSNIEISSSLFHLDPQNSTLIIGADAVINADVTANSIRTPATIGGAPSTVANASSSIDSNGFAKFVSASIGGWNVDEDSIFSGTKDTSEYSTSGITLSSAGSIHTPSFYVSTAGDAFFKGTLSAPGGNIGGFTLSADAITGGNFYLSGSATGNEFFISSSDFNVKANGDVTASSFLFEGGKITGDVSFQAPLDGSTVVYFDDFSIYPTVGDVTSTDNPKIDGSGQGYYPFQNNGELSLETGEGELFGKAFKIGNNSGNDYSWFSGNRLIPFNENSLYEMEIRVKETAGIGTHYAGITAYSKNGTTKVNATGANSFSSQYYFVLSNANLDSEFTTYRGYFKGTSSSGNGGLHNSKDDPGTVHVNVLNGYFTPMFIAQYLNDPGITYVDYIKITEFNVGGSSTVISGDTIKTGTIKSTNLTATLGTQLALDDGEMRIGGTGAYTSNNGILLDGPNSRFAVGNAGGSYIRFNHTEDKIEINTDNFDIDSSGNVTVTGTVNANAGNFTSTVTIGDGSTTGTLEVGTGDSSIKIDGTNSTSTTKIYAGAGNFNNTDTGFFIDAQGRFSLRDKLTVNTAGELGLSGSVNSTNGKIGGWTISDTAITSPNDVLSLDSSQGALEVYNSSGELDLVVRSGSLSPNSADSEPFSKGTTTNINGGGTGDTPYSITNANVSSFDGVYRYYQIESFELDEIGSYTAQAVNISTTSNANIDDVGTVTLLPLNPTYKVKIGYIITTGRTNNTTPSGTTLYDKVIEEVNWESGNVSLTATNTSNLTINNLVAGTTYYAFAYLYTEGQLATSNTGTIQIRPKINAFSESFAKNVDIVELTGGGIQIASSNTRYVRFPQVTSGRNVEIGGGIEVTQTGTNSGDGLRRYASTGGTYWDHWINGNNLLLWRYNGGGNGGYLSPLVNVGSIDFTGQHRSSISTESDNISNLTNTEKIGLIVCADGTYSNLNGTIEPSVNEALPNVSLAITGYDKRVYGVISDEEDLTTGAREYSIGNFVSTFTISEAENEKLIINSVGEGGVWVSNYSGSLENGDYITSSPIPGIGMKQDDDLLHNYTVAKITQDCYFTDSSKYIEVEFSGSTYRKQFVGCTYHCG